eukprot:scaffold18354_cov72-Skeletonema_dohrnii-CCMP3373.AAC.1
MPVVIKANDKAKEYCTYIESHLSPAISHPRAIPYHAVFDINILAKKKDIPKNPSEKQTSREKNEVALKSKHIILNIMREIVQKAIENIS